jgi:hypothetical protein
MDIDRLCTTETGHGGLEIIPETEKRRASNEIILYTRGRLQSSWTHLIITPSWNFMEVR